MAMVLPIMIVIVIGFVGMMLELRVENEFHTAVDLAAQASLVPPLDDPRDSQADYVYAFSHTLNPSGSENGYLTVTTPITCTGAYLNGQIDLNSQGIPAPVTCTAQADFDFSHTPIGLLWFWSVHLQATAEAYPPEYRRCLNTSSSPTFNPNPYQC
jgi:Flp pilus assembly protein TadG